MLAAGFKASVDAGKLPPFTWAMVREVARELKYDSGSRLVRERVEQALKNQKQAVQSLLGLPRASSMGDGLTPEEAAASRRRRARQKNVSAAL